MYRIGEFSKMVKLTVKTLRFYDETGLLAPSFTDSFTGYRYYTTAQMFEAQQIVSLRRAGFSVSEIRRILSGKDVENILKSKQAELTAELAASKERLSLLSSIKNFYSEEQSMDYQAIIKEIPECTVYYKQFKVHDFSDYSRIIPEIGEKIVAANPELKCAVPPFCYVKYTDGEFREHDFNVEYAEAVQKEGTETDGIRFKKLPAETVASVLHKGAYDGLRKAYSYLLKWVEDNGYEICDNCREQYIDGCWNKDDDNEYLTEVHVPVAKR